MDQHERDRQPDEIDLEDPLGIAREPVVPDSNVQPSGDEDSIRRRRARAGLDGHDRKRPRPGMGDLNPDSDGASGIDMGYGGEGTDVKP